MRFTLMEWNERVQCTKDLSKLTLCHDVQLQHGLIVHLVGKLRISAALVRNWCQDKWNEAFKYIKLE